MESKTFEIQGMKEVMDTISVLPVEIQKKVLDTFLLKAGKKFIADELKSTLNYSSETEKSIKAVKGKKSLLTVKAGIARNGYKIRWTDLGTKERKTRDGKNRGYISGREQVSSTIDRQIEPITKYMEDNFEIEVNKIINRRLKKINKSLL